MQKRYFGWSIGAMLPIVGALIFVAGASAAQQPAAPPSHSDVLIKNAVVMTVTHGNIQNGSVYIKDGKIAEWWMPDDVVFVDGIPHTATGKILKTALRDQFKSYRFPNAAA